MTTDPRPRHGQERNFRQEVARGPSKEYVDATTGETILIGPSYSRERPVGEKYCERCGEWKHQDGILALLLGCPDCRADW